MEQLKSWQQEYDEIQEKKRLRGQLASKQIAELDEKIRVERKRHKDTLQALEKQKWETRTRCPHVSATPRDLAKRSFCIDCGTCV